MLKFFDTHTHISMSDDFLGVRERYLNDLSGIIEISYDLDSSIRASNLSDKYNEIYFAIGVHPENAFEYNDEVVKNLIELSKSNKCLAIGEIGLDYHYDNNPPREKQLEIFISQIELASSLNKPIIIHSRDAAQDMLNTLKNHKDSLKNGFLMHCYSDSIEVAREITKLGGYFSFGGALTFKNSKRIEVLKSIPIDRILFETDCPYMTPVPFRGSPNEPDYVKYVYEYVSNSLNIDLEELKTIINKNINRFFGNIINE